MHFRELWYCRSGILYSIHITAKTEGNWKYFHPTYNQTQHSTQIHMDRSTLFFFYTFWPCTDIFMAITVHRPVQVMMTECSSSGWFCVAGQVVNVMTSYSWLPCTSHSTWTRECLNRKALWSFRMSRITATITQRHTLSNAATWNSNTIRHN